jgi:N-acetyl-beta-hexosaminidase
MVPVLTIRSDLNTVIQYTTHMKRLLYLSLILSLLPYTSESQGTGIIPSPQQIQLLPGQFEIKPTTIIVAPQSFRDAAELFAISTNEILNNKLTVHGKGEATGNILLSIDNSITNKEGYDLNISANGIVVKASAQAGIFYGLQTLRQLFMYRRKAS